MTVVKETRHIFDTYDILQLRLVCGFLNDKGNPCGGEMLYQFGRRAIDINWHCPRCGKEWKTQFGTHVPAEVRQISPEEHARMTLLAALQTLSGAARTPFTIRFEIGDHAKGKASDSEEKTT